MRGKRTSLIDLQVNVPKEQLEWLNALAEQRMDADTLKLLYCYVVFRMHGESITKTSQVLKVNRNTVITWLQQFRTPRKRPQPRKSKSIKNGEWV